MSSAVHTGSSSGPSIVGVGRAHVAMLEAAAGLRPPGHDEEAPLVARHRDDDGDLVAHALPWEGDVHPLCRSDRSGATRVVEGADRVGPHAAGIDDDPCGDVDRFIAEPVAHCDRRRDGYP